MERKTYYMILGVSSTESDKGIRAAYRDLAKRLHPDVAGEQATRSFQEVSEAYGVLSDPERRREYNSKLSRAEDGGIAAVRRSPPESLVREPVTILANGDGIRPSFEAMYDRFLRNFTGIGVRSPKNLRGLTSKCCSRRKRRLAGASCPSAFPSSVAARNAEGRDMTGCFRARTASSKECSRARSGYGFGSRQWPHRDPSTRFRSGASAFTTSIFVSTSSWRHSPDRGGKEHETCGGNAVNAADTSSAPALPWCAASAEQQASSLCLSILTTRSLAIRRLIACGPFGCAPASNRLDRCWPRK